MRAYPALCSLKAGLGLLCSALLLSGCGLSTSSSSPEAQASAPRVAVEQSRAGTIYRQEIPVAKTGDTLVVQVFEPTQLETGKTYPLVLQGHGYGGSRETTPDAFIQKLRDAGYYVISIDERGFGESSGTVRVMDPDYDGYDLIAMLDWAENLPGLRRRANGEMMVGSYGGSYGGMYQLLLYAADPKHRLRVLAPDITPHDLTYSLNANGVVKSGWGLALIAGGELPLIGLATGGTSPVEAVGKVLELAQRGQLRQDPAIYEILLNAAISNRFTDSGQSFMRYHSLRYFCDGEPVAPQSFVLAKPDTVDFAPTLPPAADVLLTQGFRDTLFNFNDGYHNYQCLKALGGDVRLLTHQSGHILPVSVQTLGLEQALDPFYAALTLPGFQDAGGTRSCGTMDLDEVQFAWFEEKLRGQSGAIDAALRSGTDFCLSLAEGDAIRTASVKQGGDSFAIDASTPQLNSLLGVVGSLLGNGVRDSLLLADQTLYTVPESGAVLAGIPKLSIDLQALLPGTQENCVSTTVQLGCDPILFFAIGHRPPGQTRWDLIDDQLTPVRGFGTHELDMTGIAERLAPGEEVALLIYAFHAQYPVTWSRDVLLPALKVSGSVQLPLLSGSEILASGI